MDDKVDYIKENFYKAQDQLLILLGEAIGILAEADSIEGMPPSKIRQLELTLYRKSEGMKEQELCSICCVDFDAGEPIRRLKCQHIYHPECIMQWLSRNRTCPVCRRDQMEE